MYMVFVQHCHFRRHVAQLFAHAAGYTLCLTKKMKKTCRLYLFFKKERWERKEDKIEEKRKELRIFITASRKIEL